MGHHTCQAQLQSPNMVTLHHMGTGSMTQYTAAMASDGEITLSPSAAARPGQQEPQLQPRTPEASHGHGTPEASHGDGVQAETQTRRISLEALLLDHHAMRMRHWTPSEASMETLASTEIALTLLPTRPWHQRTPSEASTELPPTEAGLSMHEL